MPTGPRLAGRELRVVSYNIKFGRKPAEAAQALRNLPSLHNPDILVLQEMDAGWRRAHGARARPQLRVLPGLTRSEERPRHGQRDPVAVADRGELEGPAPPPGPRQPPRARGRRGEALRRRARAARLLGPPRVAAGISGGSRREQAETVLRDARASAEPVVLAGDFNSHDVGKTFAAAGFSWPTEKVGHSAGPFSFDHVFFRGLPTRRRPRPGSSAPRTRPAITGRSGRCSRWTRKLWLPPVAGARVEKLC